MTQRMDQCFASVKKQNRPALITYFMGGYPDYGTSLEIMKTLASSGADIIELGIPFSDPMADGPAIQQAARRALDCGQNLQKTLNLAKDFRQDNQNTPIVLMGYYNPIYVYGVDRFLDVASDIGIDGLIIVDLPPEMDNELCLPAHAKGINFIRLATPTTDNKRLPTVLNNTSGFVYYVSMNGITGSKLAEENNISSAVKRIKSHTDLPVCVGFGVKTVEQVKAIGAYSDGVVVGSVIIGQISDSLDKNGAATIKTISNVETFIKSLADGILAARSDHPF